MSKDFTIAKNVIKKQIEGLNALMHLLDDNFLKTIEVIESTKGRLILSGIGKSGLVARKISSTLSSTGTPSLFLHPSEASHGDLGMITKDDVVMVLSNSGETLEIKDLVVYCNNFNITLIALIGNDTSKLAKAADIKIILPPFEEASEHKSPTTSTTMMMALGDALAITLMQRRQFTPNHYKMLHPGGKLGAIFSKVEDVMHQGNEMPLIQHDALIADAIIIMSAKRLGCVGVINQQGELIGIICDGDIRRNMRPNLLNSNVGEIMTKNPKTIAAQSFVSDAINLMNQLAITSLFIIKDKIPTGVLNIHDCLQINSK
jgi:arabinose-5-phosphate isomerase